MPGRLENKLCHIPQPSVRSLKGGKDCSAEREDYPTIFLKSDKPRIPQEKKKSCEASLT